MSVTFSDFSNIQIRRFFALPNYVRAFGLFHGIYLLFIVECRLPAKCEKIESIAVPKYSSPVYLRKCVSDHSIFWQCLVERQYDISRFKQTTRFMSQYAEILAAGRRPVIIDLGGNIGLAALWFARAFPEATIISVEPEAANFALLQRNIAVFGNRVRAVHGAGTETSKKMRIINPDAGASSFQLEPVATAFEASSINGFTIAELIADIDRAELFIVKIDIEGGQRSLFSANTDWIDQIHLVIIEIDDWQFPWQATCEGFFREMSKRRFDYLMHGENLFCYRHLVNADADDAGERGHAAEALTEDT